MDTVQEKMEFLLDAEIPDKLREEVNADVRFSVETKQKLKGERTGKLYPAWNRICAIMDRIEDLVYHINGMVVEPTQDIQSAFSFFDLLNHGAVLIDCVNMIAQIYEIDLSAEDAEDAIFHDRGRDGRGNDKAYFEYLRSLCSVHPIETSRHRRYMDAEFECCPYVMWLDDYNREKTHADLKALVYTNGTGPGSCKSIYISLSDVKAYIQRRYDLLENKIIDGIHQFKERKKDTHRKSPLKTETDFPDYVTYLQYMREKSKDRFGDSLESDFEYVFFFMCLSFSNWKNRRLLKKYQSALKYAIKFHHSALQNMSLDGFENNGIGYPDLKEETTLLWKLIHLNAASDDVRRYQYELSTQWELASFGFVVFQDNSRSRAVIDTVEYVRTTFIAASEERGGMLELRSMHRPVFFFLSKQQPLRWVAVFVVLSAITTFVHGSLYIVATMETILGVHSPCLGIRCKDWR